MRLFWEIARLSFRRQFAYRTANLAGLATNLFWGLLRAAVMAALYGTRTEVMGVTLNQAITYTALTQSLIAYLSLFGWYDLMNSVNSGEVGADLLRPMPLYFFWMARDFGQAASNLLVRAVPLILAYTLVFKITYPTSLLQWLALITALLLGWAVGFAWRFLINLTAFWTPNAIGIGRFIFSISWLLCGFLMPLRFFPDWAQSLAYLTPFPSMINTTIEAYWGLLSPSGLLSILGMQLLWFLALTVIGQLVLRAGVRNLVIQGG